MQLTASYRKLLLLTLVLPAAIVVADMKALEAARAAPRSSVTRTLLYVLFVGQVALLATVAGRYIQSWVLRWTLLTWVLVLIDLWLFSLAVGSTSCLPYTLASGQVGLLVIWAVLGPTPWAWRLPAVLVAAAGLVCCFFHSGSTDGMWSLVLVLQSAATAVLCGAARLSGFRLRPTAPGSGSLEKVSPDRPLQFSIRDMLVWTTAMVPLLVVTRGLDYWFFGYLDTAGWICCAGIGFCLAVVSTLAMWTAVGEGPAVVRYLVLAVIPPLLGLALKALLTGTTLRTLVSRTWWAWQVVEVGWQWLAWTTLAACFLAGLLLMFRTSGLRLTRQARPARDET